MKKRVAAVILALLCVFMTACVSQEKHYEPQDYILETAYKDDYRILQLTDIHLANKDDRQKHLKFLDLTIQDADADMIVVTGDLFTFADQATAYELFDFLDSYGIPWTVTFGNHDEQCYFSADWLTDYLNNYGSNCLFKDIQDDDVFGISNFAIDLMQDGKVHTQLILMDSNRYNFGEYWGYDYMKEDQIAWYEDLVNATSSENGGAIVPSLMFFHIPLPEFATAMEEVKTGTGDTVLEYGEINEKCACPQINSGMFDKIEEMGSTRAILVGHDHLNNARMKYHGIELSYGINATDRIYYDENMMGGKVVVIHPDHSLDYEAIYHSYEEVEA